MEDIFKFHQATIQFLIFPEIRSLIISAIKPFVGKNLQIDALKVKISGLKSPEALSFLPKHLQIQFDKLVKADLHPDILKVGHDFLFQKEISDLESKISTLQKAVVELEKEYLLKLEKYLSFADFSPRPSQSEDWDAFCALYYNNFIKMLKAHFLMNFDKLQSFHEKRKKLKKQKFEEFKAQRSQPLIVTEEILEQKLRQLSISTQAKKVRFSIPKTGKRSSGKGRAPAKSQRGSHQRASRSPSPRPTSRSKSPRRNFQGNKGRRSLRKRRN
jgi:hypothetical protein